MWSSLFHKKALWVFDPTQTLDGRFLCGKWTILTDPAHRKSTFPLTASLTIQRAHKSFTGICVVYFLFCFENFMIIFIGNHGNVLFFFFFHLLDFLLVCFLFRFPSTQWQYFSRIVLMTQNTSLQTTLDTSSWPDTEPLIIAPWAAFLLLLPLFFPSLQHPIYLAVIAFNNFSSFLIRMSCGTVSNSY